MPRDKSKDEILYDCSLPTHHHYICELYQKNLRSNISGFLIYSCSANTIQNWPIKQVCELIETNFGYPIPD